MQDNAWNFPNAHWGYDKYKVRNYLQTEWEKEFFTKAVAYSTAKMHKTAELVLEVGLLNIYRLLYYNVFLVLVQKV